MYAEAAVRRCFSKHSLIVSSTWQHHNVFLELPNVGFKTDKSLWQLLVAVKTSLEKAGLGNHVIVRETVVNLNLILIFELVVLLRQLTRLRLKKTIKLRFGILELQNRVMKFSYAKCRHTFYKNSSFDLLIRLRKILNFTSSY